MWSKKWSLKSAWNYVLEKKHNVNPMLDNRHELASYELKLLGVASFKTEEELVQYEGET